MKETIKISDKFTLKKMILFSLPCIGMQLVDNTYQVVDGYFISNFLGEEVFAAENMIFPPLALLMSLGLVVGAGGSAIIAALLGEGKDEEARKTMSMLSAFLLIFGTIVSAVAFVFMTQIAKIVGATDELVPYCAAYGRILAVFMPAEMMNYAFQEYLVTADEGRLGLIVSVVNAVTNIILDFLFVGILGFGLTGAAVATGIAWCVSLVVAVRYFVDKKHNLHLTSFKIHVNYIGQALGNGSSEMVDAVSYAVVAIIFNKRLITLLATRGVSAYAVTEYVTGIFYAVFMGFGIAMIPVFGYRFGEKNYDELTRLRNEGIKLSLIWGSIMLAISMVFSPLISQIFVGYDTVLADMSTYALRVCGAAFLLSGVNMFSSSFFTGISDGLSSAIIAFTRSFFMPIVLVYLLPYLFGKDSIWYTALVAEIITIVIVVILNKTRYRKDISV
ncbi:putative efflux protein, MATE family [Butyrivibrio sp. ob235]|uniref:MATE family efflux transporter n=1 Tax=Butyrivibrio sp. ob235 TaxID=1761780 RepID=UPI0008BE7084|nr:MATE family efflux transporter [Butyrivibrio sp. ob235]SEK48297.1 putative efflux protein, MATE family [Butyrivibrio sp. ob235]